MAIKQLTPEQVRTMSLGEKDAFWLAHVYRGAAVRCPWSTARSSNVCRVRGINLQALSLVGRPCLGSESKHSSQVASSSSAAAWRAAAALASGSGPVSG